MELFLYFNKLNINDKQLCAIQKLKEGLTLKSSRFENKPTPNEYWTVKVSKCRNVSNKYLIFNYFLPAELNQLNKCDVF